MNACNENARSVSGAHAKPLLATATHKKENHMSKRSPYFPLGRLISCLSIVIVAVLCFAVPGSAQTVQPSPSPLDLQQTKDFHPLFNERERLIEEIMRL